MKLGELIAVGREIRGWSLRELEERSGVSNPLISQIETGKIKDPGFTTVVALLDALGITLDRAAVDFRNLAVLRQSNSRKIDFDANSEITAGIPSPAGGVPPLSQNGEKSDDR